MRIPQKNVKKRYYVATSMTEALSSWPFYEAALLSLQRLRHFYPKDAAGVIGIIEVGDETILHAVSGSGEDLSLLQE